MAGSLAAIRTKVEAKLQTLTGSGQPVSVVYDHYTTNISGYPCVMHEPGTIIPNVEDTANNIRAYVIEVLIVQEISNTSRQTALGRMVTITDAILDMFDQDFTLTGTCRGGIEAVPAEFGQADMEDGPVLFNTIRIACRDLIDIT